MKFSYIKMITIIFITMLKKKNHKKKLNFELFVNIFYLEKKKKKKKEEKK
jgi:hypothetical protein